jgi:undecaprenyl diphosphate synthase
LDGNGRWAKKRGLPRTAGHAAGAENFRTIANYCKAMGVEYLTVYAFSTENWKRPENEVKAIMGLMDKYLREAISVMVQGPEPPAGLRRHLRALAGAAEAHRGDQRAFRRR